MSTANTQRVIALFFAALTTGALMVNWIGLARAMVRMSSASAYTEFHQATNRTFVPYMPVVVIGAVLGGVILAALSPRMWSLPGQLAMLGALCYAATVPVTLSTDARINRQIAGWSIQNPPGDWRAIRARWVRFHIVRTLISVPALVFYLHSSLVEASAQVN
jgi:uncharacterized membrane protein